MHPSERNHSSHSYLARRRQGFLRARGLNRATILDVGARRRLYSMMLLAVLSLGNAASALAQPTRLDLDRDRARAQDVANKLQEQQFKKISERIGQRGDEIIADNPDAVVPATALTVGAMLWVGRKIPLVKSDDLRLISQFEGRNRCGNLYVENTLLNGKLNFAQDRGLNFGVNKGIQEIKSDAEVNYQFKGQLLRTELRHHLTDNLAVCVGLDQPLRSRTEQNAKLQYNVSF